MPGGKVLAGDGTNVRVGLPRMPDAFVFGARLTRPLHDRPGPGESTCVVPFSSDLARKRESRENAEAADPPDHPCS